MMKINEMVHVYNKLTKYRVTFIEAKSCVQRMSLYNAFSVNEKTAKDLHKSIKRIGKIAIDLGLVTEDGEPRIAFLLKNSDCVEDFVAFCIKNKIEYKQP